jgi:hypothetical protein
MRRFLIAAVAAASGLILFGTVMYQYSRARISPSTVSDDCTPSEIISASSVNDNPQKYNGHSFCIQGYYVEHWEIFAIYPGLRFNPLRSELPEPTGDPIWAAVHGPRPLDVRCIDEQCVGKIAVYGRFEYSAAPRFGHDGSYSGQFTRTGR